MREEVIHQPKMSRKDVLAEYAKTGLNHKYYEDFWQKYSSLYDQYLEEIWYEENISDFAVSATIDGMQWYVRYREIGHPDDWCWKAWYYGAYEGGKEYEFSDYADCLLHVYEPLWSEALHSKERESVQRVKTELKRNCDYIGRLFGKSSIYMRFFYEWFEDIPSMNVDQALAFFSKMEHAYNVAREKGKDEDFAFFYATADTADNWKVAELRESLKNEGKDDAYIMEYVDKYSEGLEKNGEPREHPDIPAFWEQEVTAYMNGWDYARKSSFKDDYKERKRFIDTYTSVYLNASYHPVHPDAIPWQRFEEFVMDIAIRRFNGENVEIEPYDPESIRELSMMNREPVKKKSPSEILLEDIMDMMYPDGMDDDDC